MASVFSKRDNQIPCVECPCDVSPPNHILSYYILETEEGCKETKTELMLCGIIGLQWRLLLRQQWLLLRFDVACAAA
jgi:hypothetical protein